MVYISSTFAWFGRLAKVLKVIETINMHMNTLSGVFDPWAVLMLSVVYAGVLVSFVFMTKRRLMLLERARAPTADRLDKT